MSDVTYEVIQDERTFEWDVVKRPDDVCVASFETLGEAWINANKRQSLTKGESA